LPTQNQRFENTAALYNLSRLPHSGCLGSCPSLSKTSLRSAESCLSDRKSHALNRRSNNARFCLVGLLLLRLRCSCSLCFLRTLLSQYDIILSLSPFHVHALAFALARVDILAIVLAVHNSSPPNLLCRSNFFGIKSTLAVCLSGMGFAFL